MKSVGPDALLWRCIGPFTLGLNEIKDVPERAVRFEEDDFEDKVASGRETARAGAAEGGEEWEKDVYAMRGQMPGGPVGVLYSAVVCVRDEPDLERLQPVQAAGLAGQTVAAWRAALCSEERSLGAAAAAGREAEEGGARETST